MINLSKFIETRNAPIYMKIRPIRGLITVVFATLALFANVNASQAVSVTTGTTVDLVFDTSSVGEQFFDQFSIRFEPTNLFNLGDSARIDFGLSLGADDLLSNRILNGPFDPGTVQIGALFTAGTPNFTVGAAVDSFFARVTGLSGSFDLDITDFRIFETADLSGQITASFVPSPVPLPAALPLLGAGFAALGFVGWRRKRKTA